MALVFVAHQRTGVHPIPEEWLDGYAPSGFRYATAAEVASWYEERDLPLPPEVEVALLTDSDEPAPAERVEPVEPWDPRSLQRRPYQWHAA